MVNAGFKLYPVVINNFLSSLSRSLGLKDVTEVYTALGSTDKLTVKQVKDHASQKGRQMLKEKGHNLRDNIVFSKLNIISQEFSLSSIDELFIALGSCQLDVNVVSERLSASRPFNIMGNRNHYVYAAA